MRYYISGPMTGMPDYNRAAFYEAERKLLAAGHSAYNPARYADEHPGKTYEEYMEADLGALENCDRLLMLEGWQQSMGARREYDKALMMGLSVVEE